MRGVHGEPLELDPAWADRALRDVTSLDAVQFGAREREILRLPACPLRIVAADEVPQAARPDLSELAAAHVHDDERLGAPATQPAVLAPRPWERSRIETIAVLTDRPQPRPTVAMVEDRCQLPSLEHGSVTVQHHERVPIGFTRACVIQADRGCAEPARASIQAADLLSQIAERFLGDPKHAPPERSLRLEYPVCERRFTSLLLRGR